MATYLIARADMIVSECLMLSHGVRFELETSLRLGRSDRTVLLLPPHGGYLALLDNEPLIQQFPLLQLWLDAALHTERLEESPGPARPHRPRGHDRHALPDEERSGSSAIRRRGTARNPSISRRSRGTTR